MKNVIYKLAFPGRSELIYIGSAQNWQARLSKHLSMLRRGIHHNSHLQRAFLKYGEASLTWEILEFATVGGKDLLDREQSWIHRYDFTELFNESLSTTAPMLGRSHTREARAKMGFVGALHPLYGTKASPETRLKMSAARTGKLNHFYGKTHSAKTKHALRRANGKPVVQLERDTGVIIREWASAAEAAGALGLHFTNISSVCRHVRRKNGTLIKSTGGYRWEFASRDNNGVLSW